MFSLKHLGFTSWHSIFETRNCSGSENFSPPTIHAPYPTGLTLPSRLKMFIQNSSCLMPQHKHWKAVSSSFLGPFWKEQCPTDASEIHRKHPWICILDMYIYKYIYTYIFSNCCLFTMHVMKGVHINHPLERSFSWSSISRSLGGSGSNVAGSGCRLGP